MTVFGFALALWSTTGAMNAYMLAINLAYGQKDERSFVRKRLVALEMVFAIGFAFVLVAVLLIFGPQIEKSDLVAAWTLRAASSTSSGGSRRSRSCSPACSRRSRRCSTSGPTCGSASGSS